MKMIITQKDEFDIEEQHALSAAMGRVFEKAEAEYDLQEFAWVMINSSLFKNFFEDLAIFSQSRSYVLQLFREELDRSKIQIKTVSETQWDDDVAYWLGYLFSEWFQDDYGTLSILTPKHIEWLYNNYDVLHMQSVKNVYDEIVDIHECLMREE